MMFLKVIFLLNQILQFSVCLPAVACFELPEPHDNSTNVIGTINNSTFFIMSKFGFCCLVILPSGYEENFVTALINALIFSTLTPGGIPPPADHMILL